MKYLIVLALLPACAAFEEPAKFTFTAPATICIVGSCAELQPIMDDLHDPAFLKRVEDAKPGVPRK